MLGTCISSMYEGMSLEDTGPNCSL